MSIHFPSIHLRFPIGLLPPKISHFVQQLNSKFLSFSKSDPGGSRIRQEAIKRLNKKMVVQITKIPGNRWESLVKFLCKTSNKNDAEGTGISLIPRMCF